MRSLDLCVNKLTKLFCTSNLSVVEECRRYFNRPSVPE